MLKSWICLGLLAVIINVCGSATSPIENQILSEDGNSFVQFVSSDKLEEMLKKYPNAVEIGRTVKTDLGRATTQSRSLVTYTLGNRISSDFLVAHDSQQHTWLSPQDVRLRIDYPTTGGTGYIVTHVKIEVNQSNDLGSAYVVAGGIGYRYISLIVEAKATYWFDYDASIYGHN